MAQHNVTISPDVIRTIVRNTVLALPNVRGLVDSEKRFGVRGYQAVEVQLDTDVVRVALHVTAASDASLVELGKQIQTEVVSVVEEIVGIKVAKVDVAFEDVKV
jgi:uncharacterized alkaline shock family protein YloU